MATFDPQVQPMGDNPFVYGYGARPIQQPKVDLSGEVRGKTIGKALGETGNIVEGASKLGYQVAEDNIKSDLRSQYEPVQNEFIHRLSQVDDVLKKNPEMADLASKNYPEDIRKLPGVVDQLVALRDNGRVSSTYVDMQKDVIAKSLRAKYPGMRDVVDQQFSRLTREDPANKVIGQLTQDINAYAAAAKQQHDKIGNFALSAVKSGLLPDAAYTGYQKGQVSSEAILHAVYSQAKVRSDLRLQLLNMSVQAKRNELNKETASQQNSDYLGKSAVASMDQLYVQLPGFHDSMKASDALNKIFSGQDPNVEQDARALATFYAAKKAQWIAEAVKEGNQPFDKNNPNSHSMSSIQGPKAYQESVEAIAKELFDPTIDALNNQHYGAGFAMINRVHAHMDEQGKRALDVSPELGLVGALNKIAPQYVSQLVTGLLGDGRLASLTNDKKAYVIDGVSKAMVKSDISSRGINFNFATSMDSAASKGLNTPQYATANAAIYSGVFSVATDPSYPRVIRENATRWLYEDPTALQRFNPSSVDNRGRVTPGQSKVLADTVNTKATQAVKKLADPVRTQEYIQYAKKSTGIVLRSSINELNRFQDNPAIKISWDSDNHKFMLHIDRGYLEEKQILNRTMPMGLPIFGQSTSLPELQVLSNSITKINLALRSMVDVSTKLTHEDLSDFLSEFFVESGMDPKLLKGTIGGKFIEALIASRRKPQATPVKDDLGNM